MKDSLTKFGVVAIPDSLKFDSIATYAGKFTARVTKAFKDSDGTLWKFSLRINKDGSVSRIIEQRTW